MVARLDDPADDQIHADQAVPGRRRANRIALCVEFEPSGNEGGMTEPSPPPDEGTPPTPPPDEGTLPTPDPVPDDPEAD